MISIKDKIKAAYETLQKDFGYTNVMQAPKIEKVVISTGVGSIKDKKKVELIANRLGKITGQKPIGRSARMAIASFKSRQGDLIGYQVTIRGQRMVDFLDKVLNIALPRTRDFRGISITGIDGMGNYSFGIKENTIFPETSDEELKDVFGLSVSVVTNVKNPKETEAFLRHLGFPFKKN